MVLLGGAIVIEVDVEVPESADLSTAARLIEECCAAEGLTLTLKGTLSKYPNSVHWHFKQGFERGTLEITLWERKCRLWLQVAGGRTGHWIEDTLRRLHAAVRQGLSPSGPSSVSSD